MLPKMIKYTSTITIQASTIQSKLHQLEI